MEERSSPRITGGHWCASLWRGGHHPSKAERLRIVALTSLRVIVGFCDLLLAAAMYVLFLLLQGSTPVHHVWWMPRNTLTAALFAALLVLLRSIFDILSIRAVAAHVQNLYTAMVLRLARGYTEMSWERFVACDRSQLLIHAVNTSREAANFYHLGIELVATVTVVAAMMGALIYQSLRAACVLILTTILFYAIHHLLIRQKLRRAGRQKEQSLQHLQRALTDTLSSGKEIRTYANQDFFYNRIGQQVRSVAHASLRLVVLPQMARLLSDQGVVLAFLVVVATAEMRHGDVRELLSILVFYFVLSRRLLPLISQISFITSQMDGAYESLRLIDEQITQCDKHRAPLMSDLLPKPGFVLQLEQVSFVFDRGISILQHLDLQQRLGQVVVIRGASGSGKSTLLNLIAGVLRPETGLIGVNRSDMAYVPQDIVLFDDSIRNNLLFGLTDKTDAELHRALATTKLHEFVSAQPKGLDTRVGENGILFSGGERQRLGLARAILRGVTLLLLDEATSALDEQSETIVLDNLSASGIAVLLVTHRIHSQTFAHRVLDLQNGRLIESDTHVLDLVF